MTGMETRSLPRVVLQAVLVLLVMVSALGVIYTTHETRQQFSRLEILKDEAYQLDVQWSQLLLEQSTWGSFGRIERLARKELDMKHPTNQDVVVVTR